jgi:hypothetical protein
LDEGDFRRDFEVKKLRAEKHKLERLGSKATATDRARLDEINRKIERLEWEP